MADFTRYSYYIYNYVHILDTVLLSVLMKREEDGHEIAKIQSEFFLPSLVHYVCSLHYTYYSYYKQTLLLLLLNMRDIRPERNKDMYEI